MADITLRAAGASCNGTTSVTVTQPTGTATNDVLVAFIFDHATTNAQSAAPTGWQGQGWTYLASHVGRLQVFMAVVGKNSLTGTSWSFTGLTTRSQGMIIGYYNVNTTGYGQLDVAVSKRSNASGTYGALSITTVTNGAMVIAGYATETASISWSAESCTTLGSLDERFDFTNSTYCSIAVADKLQTSYGVVGNSTATPSSACINEGFLLALRPWVFEIGTATLSGLGTLAGIGSRTRRGLATLTGIGTVAAIGVRTRKGLATLTGIGTIATIGRRIRVATVTLSGVGLASAIGHYVRKATVTLSGTGSLSGIPQRIRYGITTLVGSSTLSGVWTRVRNGVSTLSGVGSVSAVGTVISGAIYELGSATLTGVGYLATSGVRIFTSATTMAGSGLLSTVGSKLLFVTSTLAGTGSLASKGVRTLAGKIVTSGTGSLSTVATVTVAIIRYGRVVFSGVGSIIVVGKKKLMAPTGQDIKVFNPSVPTDGDIWY